MVTNKVEEQSIEILKEVPNAAANDQNFNLHLINNLFREIGFDVGFYDSKKLSQGENELVCDATQFLGVADEKPQNDMELKLDNLTGFGSSSKWDYVMTSEQYSTIRS